MSNKTKVQLGDVFEIETPEGFAYFQYTHNHVEPPHYGYFIRVLYGLKKERPKNLKTMVNKQESFSVFFPLQKAVERGIVKIVGHEEIPSHAKAFPKMKVSGLIRQDGTVANWSIWDGTEEVDVGILSVEDQKKYPTLQIVNDKALIEMILGERVVN